MMKNKGPSLLKSAKEAFFFACAMLFALLPVVVVFANADKLGFWWLIILFAYSLILILIIYMIYRYREIVEIRAYFTLEEFEKEFKKELKLINFMDKISDIFFN